MTDPNGYSFLSYRRSRAEEAQKLIYAQREHGIPTWQDVSNLQFGLTETEIRKVLNDPATANGILFITPEVKDSPVIRNIEAPLILERHLNGDGFFAVPIAGGNLSFAQIEAMLGPAAKAFISTWNIHRPACDPIDEAAAAMIAKAVLDQRLSAIHKALPTDAPFKIEVSTRAPLNRRSESALAIDLQHLFNGRLAAPGAWQDIILPAFDRVVRALQVNGPRSVIISGLIALPAAVALGASLLSLAGVQVAWQQKQDSFGAPSETWSLGIGRTPSGFAPVVTPCAPNGKDIALLVSVAADVSQEFRLIAEQMSLPLRAFVNIRPAVEPAGRIQLGPGEASDVAHLAVDTLRKARSDFRLPPDATAHLFLAVPAGLAFMLGQLLNTFGNIQTYEHVPGDTRPYHPAARFVASN
jgi:hypothetical protein